MDQPLELTFWLGSAGFAVASARLVLWRTRRGLARYRRDSEDQNVTIGAAEVMWERAHEPSPARQEVRFVPASARRDVRRVSAAAVPKSA